MNPKTSAQFYRRPKKFVGGSTAEGIINFSEIRFDSHDISKSIDMINRIATQHTQFHGNPVTAQECIEDVSSYIKQLENKIKLLYLFARQQTELVITQSKQIKEANRFRKKHSKSQEKRRLRRLAGFIKQRCLNQCREEEKQQRESFLVQQADEHKHMFEAVPDESAAYRNIRSILSNKPPELISITIETLTIPVKKYAELSDEDPRNVSFYTKPPYLPILSNRTIPLDRIHTDKSEIDISIDIAIDDYIKEMVDDRQVEWVENDPGEKTNIFYDRLIETNKIPFIDL